MSRSDWHTSKQKVYNWPSNKSELRPHHDRLASSGPSHVIRKSIGINSGPRITTTTRPPWYTWDRPPTERWCVATDKRPTYDLGPTTPRVTCVTRQKFAWDKDFKSDLRPTYGHAERHTRQPSESWPTYKDLRPKEDPATSWVTRKRNWQVPRPFLTVKTIVEHVDFNGEWARVIASIQE